MTTNIRRACFLGDSLTGGYYADLLLHRFVDLVFDYLTTGGANYIIVSARTGKKVVDFLPYLPALALDPYFYAVLQTGTNDAIGAADLTAFETNVRACVTALRALHPCALVITGCWAAPGVTFSGDPAAYDAVLSRVALDVGASFVSLTTVYANSANYLPVGSPSWLRPQGSDGWHPNTSGHAAIAALINTAFNIPPVDVSAIYSMLASVKEKTDALPDDTSAAIAGCTQGTYIAPDNASAVTAASEATAANAHADAIEDKVDSVAADTGSLLAAVGVATESTAMQLLTLLEEMLTTADSPPAIGELVYNIAWDLASVKAKTDTLGDATVTVTSPLVEADDIRLKQGDDYAAEDGRSFGWTVSGWPDLTGHTVRFIIDDELDIEATVVADDSVEVELTAADTGSLNLSKMGFALVADIDGRQATLLEGSVTLTEVPSA